MGLNRSATGSKINLCSTRVVEFSQYLTWRSSEELIVDVTRTVPVTFCGLSNGHQSRHSNGTCIAAMSKRDLAKNHQWTQCSFGKIVCRRHTRIVEKHKPLVLMFQNSLLQDHGFFMSHHLRRELQQAFS